MTKTICDKCGKEIDYALEWATLKLPMMLDLRLQMVEYHFCTTCIGIVYETIIKLTGRAPK